MQTLLTWVFHFKSLETVKPRYLILFTFSRTFPLMSKLHWTFFIRFPVSYIMLYFTGGAEISYPISWPVCPVDQYPFGVSMCFQCYQSDDSRHSHQRTDESQIIVQPYHLYTRNTTGDRDQCPAAHQTRQVPIAILHHWLQPFVAYCTEMSQSILKFSTYAISMETAFQKFMRRSAQRDLSLRWAHMQSYRKRCTQLFKASLA